MELSAKIIQLDGKSTGEAKLSAKLFGAKPKTHLIYDMVLMQLASRRQGSAKVKTRSEVRGGGKKPYKQKGTGSARRGSSRSPLMVGGARLFGPTPRDYSYRLPKKVREQALCVVLSQKCREGKIYVLENPVMKAPKTKQIEKLLANLKIQKALVVDQKNVSLNRSVRNIADAKYLEVEGINVFDILKYDNLLISSSSLEWLEARMNRGMEATS